MPQARILIVEDEPAIAVDIAMNLEAHDYKIVEVVHSAEEGDRALQNHKVDLVMLDIQLEGEMSGVDLAAIIDRDYGIPFIYLTSFADKDTLEKAAATYPASYLVKPFKENDLAPAVKMALARKRGDRDQRLPALTMINRNKIAKVTRAEYAVIEGMWAGKTNQQIADALFLSRNTVKTHIRNIYSKVGVGSKSELFKHLRELH